MGRPSKPVLDLADLVLDMADQGRLLLAGEAGKLVLGSDAAAEVVDAARGLGQELCEGRARALGGVAEKAVGELAGGALVPI
eukprot:15430489-Alexandrium_andersonii.AAC.1